MFVQSKINPSSCSLTGSTLTISYGARLPSDLPAGKTLFPAIIKVRASEAWTDSCRDGKGISWKKELLIVVSFFFSSAKKRFKFWLFIPLFFLLPSV